MKMQKKENDDVKRCLDAFAKELPETRNELARVISSYNLLLSLHARSFEEFSLLRVIKEQGLDVDVEDPLFTFKGIKPPCPTCGEKKRIVRAKENTFVCKLCEARGIRECKFTPHHGSIVWNQNFPSLTWMMVLHCMIEGYSAKRACEFCGIKSEKTFANMRMN